MKNIIFAVLAIVFVSSLCFADEVSPPAKDTTAIFTGKVDSLSSGSMGGSNPQITVRDDTGVLTTFAIAPDAAIIGKDGNPTTLNWISQDDQVKIVYITNPDRTKTARSIKVSASW